MKVRTYGTSYFTHSRRTSNGPGRPGPTQPCPISRFVQVHHCARNCAPMIYRKAVSAQTSFCFCVAKGRLSPRPALPVTGIWPCSLARFCSTPALVERAAADHANWCASSPDTAQQAPPTGGSLFGGRGSGCAHRYCHCAACQSISLDERRDDDKVHLSDLFGPIRKGLPGLPKSEPRRMVLHHIGPHAS